MSNKVGFENRDSVAVDVSVGSKIAGSLGMYVWRPGNINAHLPRDCRVSSVGKSENGVRCEFSCDQEGVQAVLEVSPRSIGYVGTLTASGGGHARLALVWELPKDEVGFPFMPGFMYGDNQGGKHPAATYPQLSCGESDEGTKPWVAKRWCVRADRSSHGCSAVIGSENTYAIGGRDVCRYGDGVIAEKNGLWTSSCDPRELSFSLGFSNIPFTYSCMSGQNYIDRPEGFVNLDKGRVSSEFFLFLFETKCRHEAAGKLLRESYAILHDEIECDPDVREAVFNIADALVKWGYCEAAKNFHTTISDDNYDDGTNRFFSSGWAGGVQVAFPLLRAAHQLGKVEWVECARSVISNLAENAVSEGTGLFYDNYDLLSDKWSVYGWWHAAMEDVGHSGYVNGHVCHYMLKAYLLERENGNEQKLWYESAKNVLDHVADEQGDDGRFGNTYSKEDGRIIDDSGFCGCWFVPAFAQLYQITQEKSYLDIAGRAMDYYRQFVESFHVYGCPHDAYKSPDEEGILAWINAATVLHSITGDKAYLDDLRMGLDYEFSWKFAYNVQSEVEPLKSMKWASTGGSVTSVNNSHIHPMGSAIAECILYAARQTGDSYYWSRLSDTLRWTLNAYLHYDGEYGWGKKGLINERFCYTDSLLTERFPDGSPASTWFCGHSWASGSVLEGISGGLPSLSETKLAELIAEPGRM